ncbi:MAG: hypothetical protein RI907_2311 [Pseudomonadota bacterium]|jgi:predicted alpha/beta hydrolase family esterase
MVSLDAAPATGGPVRVLIVPGLNNSGPGHWQTWLQAKYPGAVRVVQTAWHQPELLRWSERIAQTLARQDPETRWVAVAHSFGCLALAHHLGLTHAKLAQGSPNSPPGAAGGIRAAFMVAPASPDKFGIRHLLPDEPLGLNATLVSSDTDPWMSAQEAAAWARTWGVPCANAGDVGHINVESGHGPWPLARHQVDEMIRQVMQPEARPERQPGAVPRHWRLAL